MNESDSSRRFIDQSDEHDLIDEIADEIVTRQQAGEVPKLAEYCQRHPELESELRELFPMLVMLKDAKSIPEDDAVSVTHPKNIGGYRILGELGRGGMGIVFEAEHQGLGRRVALKVLTPRLTGREQARVRFEREARAVAQLHHTNIVPLFEVGEDGDHFFFAMQLIRGKSVQELIDELHAANHADKEDSSDPLQAIKAANHPFRWNIDSKLSGSSTRISQSSYSGSGRDQHFQSIANIGLQAADALGYAHERSIIHRDVKPSNLLVDESGTVWVTDFGLAKTNEEEITQSGEFLGTLRYMAPERFRNECDARADIYGLGLTLYELIAMQPAFHASDRLRLIGIINKTDPTRLRSLNPRVPRDLETIVMKAIDKDPRARYQSARDFVDDLYRYIHDQPIKARRHSLPEQLVRWSRKNRGLAASFCGIGVLLLLGVLGLAYTSVTESNLRRTTESALELAQEREEKLQKTSDELWQKSTELNAKSEQLQRNLYIAEMILAGQAVDEGGGIGRVQEIVSRWAARDQDQDPRDWEWYYLRSLYDRELYTLKHGKKIWCARISPRGDWIAFGDDEGRLWMWNPTSDEPAKELGQHKHQVRDVAWKPDGTLLASSGPRDGIKLWDPNTGRHLRDIPHDGDIGGLAWHPTEPLLASGEDVGGLKIWKVDTGELSRQVPGDGSLQSIDWSPNGANLAGGNANRKAIIWDAKQGIVENTFTSFESPVFSVEWHPNGSRLATCDTGGGITTLFVRNPRIQWSLNVDRANWAVTWSPDGRKIASVGVDRALRVWNGEYATPHSRYEGHTADVWDVDWSQDGDWIVTGSHDGTVKVWDAHQGFRDRTFLADGTRNEVECVEWSPIGTRLAVAKRNTILVIDAKTGERLSQLKGHRGRVTCVSWNSDGTRLASSSADKSAIIWDVETEMPLTKFAGHVETRAVLAPNVVHSVDWSRDDQFIASSSHDGSVYIWNAVTGEELAHYDQYPYIIRSATWHPQSDTIVLSSADNDVKLWNQAEDQSPETVGSFQDQVVRARWSPDGRLIAATSRDGTAQIIDATRKIVLHVLKEHVAPVTWVAWNPTGTRLATVSQDRSLRVWDVVSGSQTITIKDFSQTVNTVGWSPDGKLIATGSAAGLVRIWDATVGYERALSDP